MFTIRNCFFVIMALLIPAGLFAEEPQCLTCTQNTVVGTYAVAAEGITMMTLPGPTQKMPVPVASLSIVTINREGEVSAAGYMAVGGEAQWASRMPGTVTVNSDCTGKIVWKDGEGETLMIGELIINKGGDEIDGIMIQGGPLGAPIITGRWKRISRVPNLVHQGVCSPGCVSGTYVASQSGINMVEGVGALPAALLGRVTIHRNGTAEMIGTSVVAGTPVPFTLDDALWEEGEFACTGTISGSIMAGGTIYKGEMEGWMVVLDHGNELWGIGIESPGGYPVVLGIMKRVSRPQVKLE